MLSSFIMMLLLSGTAWAGFTSLEQAAQYVAHKEEFPESEADDLEHPNFSAYYTSLEPRWWNSILRTIRLQSAPLWDPAQFLIDLIEFTPRTQSNFSKKAVEYACKPGDIIVVVGALHGNVHSLVRIMQYWQKNNVIDGSFKIKDPRTLIVCMGNAIDYSAYSLETIALLIELMRANPERFYYLKGVHEDKRTWQDFSLYDEVSSRFSARSLLRDNVARMDEFFDKLPTSLTVTLQGDPGKLLLTGTSDVTQEFTAVVKGTKALAKGEQDLGLRRIEATTDQGAHWTAVSAPIRIYRMFNNFFYDSYAQISLKESFAASTISLFFNQGDHAFKQGPTYNLITGVLLERGIAAAHVRSQESIHEDSETIAQQVTFLSDELQALSRMIGVIEQQLPKESKGAKELVLKKEKESKDSSKMSLVNKAIRLERTYNRLVQDVADLEELALRRGLTIAPQQETAKEKPIVLGSTMDLSKSVKGLGIPFKSGISLRINEENQKGGIHGRRVQMIFMDDGYIPSISRRNIEKIVYDYHTPFVLAPIGTPTLLASLELIKQKKALILFPQSGSLTFRKPDLTNVVNYRASFDDEGRLLTDFVLKRHLPKNFVFFYQDDQFGISILNGAKRTLKKEGVTPGVEVSYLANTTLFHEAAQKIKNANPDAIGFFATGPATLQLIRDLGVEFLANKTLYAVSSVGDEATVKVLKEKGLSMILGQVVPNPITSDIEIVKDYRQQVKLYGQKENVFSLEAYIVTSITLDLMKAIEGPITVDKVLKKVESLKQYNFKGLTLNFNEKNRSLAYDLWIDTGEGEWVKKRIEQE